MKSKIASILLLTVSLSNSLFLQEISGVSGSQRLSDLTISSTVGVHDNTIRPAIKLEEDIYFDVSNLEFISKVDISSNKLLITSKDNITYDRAQLTNLETNTVVSKIKLTETNNAINLEDIKPGKYMLIISNEKGMIRSEELYIY